MGVNDYLKNRSIGRQMQVSRLSKSEAKELSSFLDKEVLPDLRAKLQSRLSRIKSRGYDAGPWTTQRYKDMRDAMRGDLKEALDKARVAQRERLVSIAKDETKWTADLVKKASTVELGTPTVAELRAIVSQQPFQGATLSQWYSGLANDTATKLDKQLKIGLAQGETVEQLSSRVSSVLGGVTKRQAEAIARTATNATVSSARLEMFKRNTDVIDKVMFVATLDDRTTPYCMVHDGRVYTLDEAPIPGRDTHWNCRSTLVPVLKSLKSMGIDMEDIPDSTRASMDGQVPEGQRYETWLREQDMATKVEALGARRAAVFNKGVPLNDLITPKGDWRPLKQLDGLAPPLPKEDVFPSPREIAPLPTAARLKSEALTVNTSKPVPSKIVEAVATEPTPYRRPVASESVADITSAVDSSDINAAEVKARAILDAARNTATRIITTAQNEAEAIIAEAEQST